MKILVVDTAEQSSSVALVEDGNLLYEVFSLTKTTHSKTLMQMVSDLIGRMDGLTIQEVDGFVAACGPGSFTGLRIGISVVKGLAFANSKPVAGISSLDGIAWQQVSSEIPVCVMMDAKRGEVYYALYHFNRGHLKIKSEERALSPDNVLKLVGKEAMFVGSGAVAFQRQIKEALGDGALFAPGFQNVVRASALAYAFFEKADTLSFSSNILTPVYLRRSDAEINFKRRIHG